MDIRTQGLGFAAPDGPASAHRHDRLLACHSVASLDPERMWHGSSAATDGFALRFRRALAGLLARVAGLLDRTAAVLAQSDPFEGRAG